MIIQSEVKVTHAILQMIAELDEFKGSWKHLRFLSPDLLNSFRKVATIESVGSSTRIEGAKLSDSEVEKLLSGLSAHSFRSRDEEEVAGYAEAMNTVFESFNEISLTENHIRQLHAMLLKHSSKDTRTRGEYKKFPNHVEAFDKEGKSLGIIFETTSPFDTPRKMKQIVEFTIKTLSEKELHPLIAIAIFIVHFLAIHPFQDGNGRLSRILTTLLLLRSGYEYVPYASLEAVIEANKDDYYLFLRKTQRTFNTPRHNIQPWLIFFLHLLKAQKDNLTRKIERGKGLLDLPALSRQLLELAKFQGHLTLSMATKSIVANERTIRDHIRRLVKDGYLVKHGERKGTFYTVAL
ncbi:MAG: Fic family protein [Dissulfurispiraceae bacterium]|jgi:Fic family protein